MRGVNPKPSGVARDSPPSLHRCDLSCLRYVWWHGAGGESKRQQNRLGSAVRVMTAGLRYKRDISVH